MPQRYFHYDEPYARTRRKTNWFAWTVAILLLTGFTFAAWLGSYYIFEQPERPESYRILQKLRKVDQPKRFQLTAAPAGEFLTARALSQRWNSLGPAELGRVNAELVRNYIRNYQHTSSLVPYVVGRFTIVDARELGPDDIFTSGMVALTSPVDSGELLLEHVYPADEQAVPLMKQTLATGLEVKLERLHDLSAVVHVERLQDGRLLLTAVPLLYGSYTVTQGRGTFTLEPPYELNLAGGWPLYKQNVRRTAEQRFAEFRQRSGTGPSTIGFPLPGVAATPTPSEPVNELVRIEQAIAVATPEPTAEPTPEPATTVKGKLAKGKKASPSPTASPAAIAAASPAPTAAAAASPATALEPTSDMTLASTAGVATWTTYPPGKMPAGRLITPGDLRELAERGMAGERVYLGGQFVVNFAEGNRAVLRPRSTVAQSVLRLGAPSSTRVIVEFPAGRKPPEQGAAVNRDAQRPFEITEVRRQADGQLNVFVREIMD